jgi:cysteine desulfurase
MRISDFFPKKRAHRVYLDYAAATPVDPQVLKAMLPYFSEKWGNPSAVHTEGRMCREAIETAREELARTLHIRTNGVVFTGNGTESNNLVLFGIVDALHASGRKYGDMEIISTEIEHPSIHESLGELKARGVTVTYIPVDGHGRVNKKSFEESLNTNVVLVTCAYVNSEIGVVEDIKGISRIIRKFNDAHNRTVKMHTDASQAPLWLPCQLDMLGVDLMTLDAGKCYGPKGVGVLAMRQDVSLNAQLHGGGQERGLRSGTENTPLIIGCVRSIISAQNNWESQSVKTKAVRDYMIAELTGSIAGAIINGPLEHRVANNVNVSIPGIDSEFAVVTLDTKGIAASTKSACGSVGGGGSRVVEAIGGDTARSASTVRFSLGRESTRTEVKFAVDTLAEHIEKMRALLLQ